MSDDGAAAAAVKTKYFRKQSTCRPPDDSTLGNFELFVQLLGMFTFFRKVCDSY